MLQNASFLAIVAVDTEENEPLKKSELHFSTRPAADLALSEISRIFFEKNKLPHLVDLAELARQTVLVLEIDFDTAANGPREGGPFSTRSAAQVHLLMHFKSRFRRWRPFHKQFREDPVEALE